jgi:hypothetical protein
MTGQVHLGNSLSINHQFITYRGGFNKPKHFVKQSFDTYAPKLTIK